MKCGSTESTARKARLMRGNGITYDTGFFNAGVSTHEPFDPEVVKREMRIIHDDLHCNAVRITGGNADRLEIAAIHAADASLEVWFSPFTCDLTTDELLDFLTDCAERAERLRRQGAEVVFVTGAELSLFTVGFLPSARPRLASVSGSVERSATPQYRSRASTGRCSTSSRLTPIGRSRSSTDTAMPSVPSSRRESPSRSPSSVVPPSRARPTRAPVAG